MVEFARFEPVAPVPDQTLESLAAWPGFPVEILDLWRTWGTGFVGEDGYVRVIDPAHYIGYLSEWFTDTEGAVPFLATGMGDLFVWQPTGEPGGVIRHVMYRVGDIRNIAPQFESLFSFLENDQYLDTWLQRGDYGQAVARLGRPDLYEAFFYAPFLPLGGTADAAHLDRGDLAVSLSVFTQMLGKASIVPGRPPAGEPVAHEAGPSESAGARQSMNFEDRYVSVEHRFSLGEETVSGTYFLSFPVSNGLVDYEEYYALDDEEYQLFKADPESALPLLERCRKHEQDDRLIQKPGSNRGTPI